MNSFQQPRILPISTTFALALLAAVATAREYQVEPVAYNCTAEFRASDQCLVEAAKQNVKNKEETIPDWQIITSHEVRYIIDGV